MNSNELFIAIKSILESPKFGVYDTIQESPGQPYYHLRVPTGRPIHDTLVSDGNHARHSFWVMGVNNSAFGCRLLTDRARDLLDHRVLEPRGWPIETYEASIPIEEDGPGDWRWSSTLSFAVHLRR